jgi:hypothetical protein
MRRIFNAAAVVVLVQAGLVAADTAPAIEGEYVEARTCDVWTGPCFSNSEMNTRGEFAVLGWNIRKGAWNGQDLSGLRIAAAIRAQGTLSTEAEGKVRAIVYVDKRATAAQKEALVAMARKLSGKYIEDIVQVRDAEIAFRRDGETASLEVGDVLKVQTQPLNPQRDKHCGNEEPAYAALAKTDATSCAKTLAHYFRDEGLKARWSDPHTRSARVGAFSL